ncbi:MAG TPA: hypothetical protein VFR91_07640 [Dyella sp.]|nr:hypothetical protein [Dyella sp.]
MLALESSFWSELRHAYGAATDIPALLGQLASYPDERSYQDEPWFTLWSSLCHQGDIYSASFAAVPHIVQALAANTSRASVSYFLLPASIEVARDSANAVVPPSLSVAYFAALAQLPVLAGAAARPDWDESLCTSALAATAAATGNHQTARLLLETEQSDIPEVLNWLQSR